MGRKLKRDAKEKERQFVRKQDLRQRHEVLRSKLGGLQVIASHLNQFTDEGIISSNEKEMKEMVEAWKMVEAIVSCSSLEEASACFNVQAKKQAVYMYVEYPVKGIEKNKNGLEQFVDYPHSPPNAAIAADSTSGTALWHLWLFYFRDDGWLRLKRCPVCRTWFVDTSKNKSTRRCSEKCTWRYWSRDRRKEEHSKWKGANIDGTKGW